MKDIIRIQTYPNFLGELTATYKRTKKPTTKIGSSRDTDKFIRPYFDQCMDDHEEMKIIHLNNNNNVVNIHHLSVGGITGVYIDIRLILRNALLIHTVGLIMVHNHPSGSLKFSNADISMSKKVKQACDTVGLKLLDSIVITRESYKSMADNALL